MIRTKWLMGCNDNLADALAIRKRVFIEEQGMPEAADVDGTDSDSFLLVAYDGEKPVATGRIHLKGGDYTIGRIAVLKEARGQGLGDFIVRLLLRQAYDMGGERQFVDSREDTVGFYEGFGFKANGEPFDRGGVSHIRMAREGDIFGKCKGKP